MPEPGDADILETDLEVLAAGQIARAVLIVPSTEADGEAVDAILNAGGRQALPYAAFRLGRAVTPGMWAFYLAVIASSWNEPGARVVASQLVILDEVEPNDPEHHWFELLELAVEALGSLADRQCCVLERSQALRNLARAAERENDADTAYNLAAVALDLGPEPGAERLELAEYALSLASAANRPHQCAIVATEILASKLALAEGKLDRRIDVFDSCERAVEWTLNAESPFREVAAAKLVETTRPHEWLQLACAPLGLILPGKEALAEALGIAGWPARVQMAPMDQWVAEIHSMLQQAQLEREIDAARLVLTPAPPERHAAVDWVTWSLDFSAYRRAVPHNRSFLREQKFPDNILVLLHETTHALSLLGGVGTGLLALRSAGFYNELALWQRQGGREVWPRIEAEAVAPLVPGRALDLLLAERGIELSLKAAALQDAWTPWFEGLACFAEGAVDPSQDADRISLVASVLRNLVDFHPGLGEDRQLTEAEVVEAFETFNQEFERRVGEAIDQQGWQRLYSDVALLKERHYFAGYLALRAILARWRRTLGRLVTGAEAFDLLLHATRFGTFEAIPDLSLPIDAFEREARAAMARWAVRLAALDKQQLEHFLTPPPRNRPGKVFIWRDGRLEALDSKSLLHPDMALEEQAVRRRMVLQANASLLGEGEADRLATATPLLRLTVELIAESARDAASNDPEGTEINGQLQLIDMLMCRGSIFPLGRCSARFFLNMAPDGISQLTTFLRTTEAHVDTGEPSVNGLSMPIDRDLADRLAARYRAEAKPRIEVTRVIDLAGVACQSMGPGTHLLAFRYGDWQHLIGASQAIDASLRSDETRFSLVTDLVARRLEPTPLDRAETVIASGEAGARRTLDWIGLSSSWAVPQVEVDASAWAERCRGQAERLLDLQRRSEAWSNSAVDLLTALWGDERPVHDAATLDYWDLVAGHSPDDLIKMLFRTAQQPVSSEWLDQHGDALIRDGVAIFERTGRTWDVIAAVDRR